MRGLKKLSKLKKIGLSLLILVISGLIFIHFDPTVLAQVPPATTICIIIPGLCGGGGIDPPPDTTQTSTAIMSKSSSISGPVKTGAVITYKINFEITTTPAPNLGNNFTLSDNLPTQMEYILGSVKLDSVPYPDPSSPITNPLIWRDLGDNGPHELTFQAKIGSVPCNSPILANKAQIYYKEDSGHPIGSTSDSRGSILIPCKLSILGDVGSTDGKVETNMISVEGPAVVVAKDTVDAGVIDSAASQPAMPLSSYSFGSSIAESDGTFAGTLSEPFDKLASEAKVWATGSSLLSENGLPGVKKTDDPTLRSSITGPGTIIYTGTELTIDTLNVDPGPVGIYAPGTQKITIRSIRPVKDVGIFAPNRTVDINLPANGSINWTGFIVAKNITFTSTGDGGNITWSGAFAKNPPPGFADLMKGLQVTEVAPE